MTLEELRQLLVFHLRWLHAKGLQPDHVIDRPQDIDKAVVVEGDTVVAYLLGEAEKTVWLCWTMSMSCASWMLISSISMRLAQWARLLRDSGRLIDWREAADYTDRMDRPSRFEHTRFLGDKRTQLVYDLDSWTDQAIIDDIVAAETGLCFGPDTLVEARNRGYVLARAGLRRMQRKPRS